MSRFRCAHARGAHAERTRWTKPGGAAEARDLCLGARPLRRSQGEMTGARRMKQTPVILAAATVPGKRRSACPASCDSSCSAPNAEAPATRRRRSEEHTSELQTLMRISYDVYGLKKKIPQKHRNKQNK